MPVTELPGDETYAPFRAWPVRGKIRYVYLAVFAALLVAISVFLWRRPPDLIRGAVVVSDADPARELPLGGVVVTILDSQSELSVQTDAAGFFTVPMPWHLRPGQSFTLRFEHAGYQSLDLPGISSGRLWVAHLVPLVRAPVVTAHRAVTIANVVVKYSIRNVTSVNVGSAVKMFQAVNTGNIPCKGHSPCSPDGKWKAVQASTALDAGLGNEFQNARASCIAGPCPFTRILDSGTRLSPGSRTISVSVLNWSDTATFLLEAEVYRPTTSDALRQSYPVIFGRDLTFTLPTAADGVSIEADLDDSMIVFPIGPALFLSWAECQLQVNPDKTRVYRCQLKPGYRFATPKSPGS